MPAAKTPRVSAGPKKSLVERQGQFLTIEEVADILAVTPRMVRRLIDRGELRATKIGKLVRIHVDDLEAYIARQRGEAL